MDTLGLDKSNRPVIIEYKRRLKDTIINQGLFYLAWLMDHRADFELLVLKRINEGRINEGAANNINWSSPRLLCVAAKFSQYDYAMQQMNPSVELIRYRKYGENLLMLEFLIPAASGSPGPVKSPMRVGPQDRIYRLVKENPRRPGSNAYASWEVIRDGMTVGEFLEEGGLRKHLRSEVKRGRVEVKSGGGASKPGKKGARSDSGIVPLVKSIFDEGKGLTESDAVMARLDEKGVRYAEHTVRSVVSRLRKKHGIKTTAGKSSKRGKKVSRGKYSAVIAKASAAQKNRLAALETFIKSLDGDVHGYQTKNYIAFKVNQAFASIRLRNSLDVILLDLHHLNPGEINPIRDIAEARGKVVRISIRYRRDVNRIKPFIRKSYKGSIAKHSGASQVNNGGKRKVTNRVLSRRVSKFPLSRGVFTAKYKGRTYEARELEDGAVEFNGKRYNSFTAVAKEITGYKVINGRDFFGVKKGGAKKATSRASHRLDPRLPPVGTTITRKYNGRIYEVKVLKSGFKLSGKRYQTLSAVAKKITGHRAVSGFHFFKLNK